MRCQELLALGIFSPRSRLGGRIELLLREGRTFSPRASVARVAVSCAALLGFVVACSLAPRFLAPRWIAFAQEPAFDVASVRLLPPPNTGRVMTGGGPGTSDPARLTRSNVTLASILAEAFRTQGNLIVGPGWLSSERYEIVASVPPGATRDDIPRMLQGLLAERFGLAFHRERADIPAYALVVGKNGPKLKPSGANPEPIQGRDGFPNLPDGVSPGAIKIDSVGATRRVAAGAMSMAEFAGYLAGQADLPVTDMTHLTGSYDIVIYYSRQISASTILPPVAPPADSGPDLASALREQLGLELQTQKIAADRLIIDHIEKTPTPN